MTASSDGTARIWQVATGKQLQVISEPGGATLNRAAFNAAGTELVTVSKDGSTIIWDIKSGRELTVIREPAGPNVDSAEFSPYGHQVLTANDDSTGIIWSAELASALPTLERFARQRSANQLTPEERTTCVSDAGGQ